MKETLTFIVPYRGRKEHLPGLLLNIKQHYKQAKIILCCQNDNLLFRKGQLANLGFLRAESDIVAFVNLDYRFIDHVDLVAEIEKRDHPIVPFLYSSAVLDGPNGSLKIVKEKAGIGSYGGCQVFHRSQFEKIGGNTNLILGWGPDDVVLNQRTMRAGIPLERLLFKMGHVKHSKSGSYHLHKIVYSNRIMSFNPPSNCKYDSFRETIAKEVCCKQSGPNVIEYKFKDIRIPEDFKEMTRYKRQLQLEKEVLGLK